MVEMQTFNPIDYRSTAILPERISGRSAWVELLPLGMLVIELVRPKRVVELGVYAGHSFCAFCQAASVLELDVECLGVDTWQGDAHAGVVDDGMFNEISSYVESRYAPWAKLFRGTFDQALATVPDGTVDLLHIDGFHSYDAVRHDFESWLPKLSVRGVVLFHDTAETREGFGVWKLWKELRHQYRGYEFRHGHGLGILLVGSAVPSELVEAMNCWEAAQGRVDRYFAARGACLQRLQEEAFGRECERTHREALEKSVNRYQSHPLVAIARWSRSLWRR